jgi:hypothetical protein
VRAWRFVSLLLALPVGCAESHIRAPVGDAFDAGTRDGAEPDPDSGAEDVIWAFFEELAAARCENAVRCEARDFNPVHHQADRCHPRAQPRFETPPEYYIGQWRAGRTRFDSDAAAACLNAFDRGCVSRTSACDFDAVFVGVGAPGADCTAVECNEASVREWDPIPADPCERVSCVCIPAPGEGESCDYQGCRDGLECSFDRTCRAILPIDSPCTDEESFLCGPDARCFDGVCTAGPFGPDHPCDYDFECAGFLLCSGDGRGRRGTCTAGAAHGAACSSDVRCGTQLRCVEGMCRSIALPGGACDDAVCPHGLWCERGICVPQPFVGEACTEASSCARGFCTDGHCVALASGGPCEWPDPVPLGSCEIGVCFLLSDLCPMLVGEGEECDEVASNRWCSVDGRLEYGSLACAINDAGHQVCIRVESTCEET